MNRIEVAYRSSRIAVRLGSIALSRKFEQTRGQEPTRILHTLIFSDYAAMLGIQKGSAEDKQLKKIIPAITDLWFKADAILDQDALYKEQDKAALDEERKKALSEKLCLDESIPGDMRQNIETMELLARKRAYIAHLNFMASFNPRESTFEDVISYRANTTGLLGETIVNAMNQVAGKGNDARLIDIVRKESLCLQFVDDLVDSVSDFRKGLPNLYCALLLENPIESRRFEAASLSQDIVNTRRPYNIAQIYSPDTISSYMHKFFSLSSELPATRKKMIKDIMALGTYLSFTPNGSLKGTSLSEVRKILARKTEID